MVKRILPFLVIAALANTACTTNFNHMLKSTRQPAVAGQFYPASADEIKNKINGFLDEVELPVGLADKKIKAIMVSHAGYDYSGQVAANSFSLLKGKNFKTVIIVGNSHTSYFDGIAIDANDNWQTPLARVEVDKDLANKLIAAGSGSIKYDGKAHERDHILEVEIPWLQTVLKPGFKILPVLFGNKTDYQTLSKALDTEWRDDYLLVISTDMSHYPSYDDANTIDQQTLKEIKQGNIAGLDEHIKKIEKSGYKDEQTLLCGIDAVKIGMELANKFNWGAEILKYLNSGDTSRHKTGVVGYGAAAFFQNGTEKKNGTLSQKQKDELLRIAKETVDEYVGKNKVMDFQISDERLNWREGAFVTLKNNGSLRGCIGLVVSGGQSLWQVVRDMAIAAATEDTRFEPVSKKELASLEYEISVLSEPKPIDNWKNIELGKHGVIIKKGGHSGLFLPQVATETGWSKEEFLGQLCWQKAGLEPECYKNGAEIQVFEAQVF